jgi:hypothetical protein
LLHQLIFHIHTHTFQSTAHIFRDIHPFGQIKDALFSSSCQLSGENRSEVNFIIIFELQLVLQHQLIFHNHTHTLHSTEHIFHDIHPFGQIKAALISSSCQLSGENRSEVNGPIIFELQLVLLHQVIFHIHTYKFHSTKHIFCNIHPFGQIKAAFSLSSRQLPGEKQKQGKWPNCF